MFLVLLNCVGILAGTPVNNSQYPTYKYALSYECNYTCSGPSFTNVDGVLYVSSMGCNIKGIVFANDENDYYLQLSSFDLTINHYSVTDDDIYTSSFSLTFERDNLSGLKAYSSNIENDGYLSFTVEYSDVIEAHLTSPLRVVYSESEYYSIPREAYYYASFDYHFSFQYDFKTQLEKFLQVGANSFENYDRGFNDGYTEGYNTGNIDGYNDGFSKSQEYYQDGYTAGYTEGATQDETAVAIFSGIISIALIPINFFLACLNFEVFGINIGAFVSAMLTVAIVVIITRIIVAGGNGGDK